MLSRTLLAMMIAMSIATAAVPVDQAAGEMQASPGDFIWLVRGLSESVPRQAVDDSIARSRRKAATTPLASLWIHRLAVETPASVFRQQDHVQGFTIAGSERGCDARTARLASIHRHFSS